MPKLQIARARGALWRLERLGRRWRRRGDASPDPGYADPDYVPAAEGDGCDPHAPWIRGGWHEPRGPALRAFPRIRSMYLRRLAGAAGAPCPPGIVPGLAASRDPASAWYAACHRFDHPDGRRATRGYVAEALLLLARRDRVGARAPSVDTTSIDEALDTHDLPLARCLVEGLGAVVAFRTDIEKDAPRLGGFRTFLEAAREILDHDWAACLDEIPALREQHLGWRVTERRYRTLNDRISTRLDTPAKALRFEVQRSRVQRHLASSRGDPEDGTRGLQKLAELLAAIEALPPGGPRPGDIS